MVRCPVCGESIGGPIRRDGFNRCPICLSAISTLLPPEETSLVNNLFFSNETSFKFKQGKTLNDVVLAFRDYFEKENEGHSAEIREADLLSGKLAVLEVSRGWFFGGTGVALILFYSEDNDSGRAAAYVYNKKPESIFASEGPKSKLTEQVSVFFSEKCDQIIQVNHKSLPESLYGAQKEEPTTELQPQGWLAPIRFCQTCDAAIAIDESTYCWNCGSKLPAREKEVSQYGGEEISKTQPTCDEIEYDRNCMICRLGFRDGQLLAWCPHCGTPAHRVHLLEWLHVKGTCPACGQQLATPELEEQLSKAHLQQLSQAQPRTRRRSKSSKPPII